MDALNQPGCGPDVETAIGPYGNPTQVGACLFAGRYYRPYEVSRLEPEGVLAAGKVSAREAVLGEPCTLIAAASGGLDTEYGLLPVLNDIHMTNAGGIKAMLFGHL
jgi:hypothetical protein